MNYLAGVITLAVLYISRSIYKFVKNVLAARAVGLPIVFVPVDQTNLFWLVLSPANRVRIQRFLPSWVWERVQLAIPGWELFEIFQPFDKFTAGRQDKSFTLVGPSQWEVWTADPQAAHDILRRIHDFEQPPGLESLLGKFGPNVVTSNGEQWVRHRKIVATVLNERISRAVFEETVNYSQQLLRDLLSTSEDGSASTVTPLLFEKLTQITLSVLISAGIGDKFPWLDEKGRAPEPPYQMGYMEALHTYVNNAFGIAMLPSRVLNNWPSWAPYSRIVKRVGRSMTEFRMRNQSLVDQERRRIAQGELQPSSRADFIAQLVQASEAGEDKTQVLSESEMISNLFAFTAGGFKTIATALDYSVVLMARLPQWQEWLLEEVDALLPATAADAESLEYTIVHPQAVRTLAFVMEVMRLYGSSSRLFRETPSPQILQTSAGNIVHLPARARVYVDSIALHHLPSWRDVNRQSDPAWYKPDPDTPDEDIFRPSRWINPPGSAHTHFHPPKGTFVPWSQGPRICPGQKMAQVEITTLLLCLLRQHRVEAARLDGETRTALEERLDKKLRDVRWAGIVTLKKDTEFFFQITQRR